VRLTFNRASTPQLRRRLGFALFAAITCAAAIGGTAAAAPVQSSAPPCGFVVKGAPWKFKGQTGTAYTVIALSGASCATAHAWVPRLTREHASFELKPVPTGWRCTTAGGITTGLTMTGQCTTRGGGIVEWLPKLRK
jgi:hypothetical protein